MKTLFAACVLCLIPATSFAAPTVVDAQGKVVGPLVASFFTDSSALIDVGSSTFIAVPVSKAGFTPSAPTYWFKTKDCSGTKYLVFGDIPQTGYVVGNNSNLLVYGVDSEEKYFVSRSYFASTGSFGGGACITQPSTRYGAPVKVFSLTSLHVVPPFKITVQ